MKLNEKQKSMIKVLQLAHDNLNEYGLCKTLRVLCYNDKKITVGELIDAQNFMRKHFSSDIAFFYHKSWWLSEYEYINGYYIVIGNSESDMKQGFTQRKNLLLDAIVFIKATGVTE